MFEVEDRLRRLRRPCLGNQGRCICLFRTVLLKSHEPGYVTGAVVSAIEVADAAQPFAGTTVNFPCEHRCQRELVTSNFALSQDLEVASPATVSRCGSAEARSKGHRCQRGMLAGLVMLTSNPQLRQVLWQVLVSIAASRDPEWPIVSGSSLEATVLQSLSRGMIYMEPESLGSGIRGGVELRKCLRAL